MLTPLLLLFFLNSEYLPGAVDASTNLALAVDSAQATVQQLVPYAAEIDSAARTYKLPPSLLAGVIQEESRFVEWATREEPRYLHNRKLSKAAWRWSTAHNGVPNAFTELSDRARSYGLMQVMGETAREQGFTGRYLAELYLPRNSIECGALLLKRLLKRYHNDTLSAISAYNQGSARKHGGVFANARYVYRVTLAWRAYERVFKYRTRR